ncbi:MAG: membrane protein insertion efficiency factor YidD [Bacteroidota bacterium]|nr:membrane protein insertion efficiency factor YidD [Bacteroidota bacterium]
MKIFIIISFLTSFIIPATGYSQSSLETAKMKQVIHPHVSKKIYASTKDNINEMQYLFSGLFLFYKAFISSQDGQSCSFTPSCSEFGMEAVKKQGAFTGILNTVDRLTRCNGLSPEKYQIDKKTNLLLDPL